MNKIILEVPYSEKNDAKALGARWDAKEKTWFITTETNPGPFKRWLSQATIYEVKNSITPIFIITSYSNCWKCKRESKVFGIASSGYIYKGERRSRFTVYKNVENVSSEIEELLAEAYPSYRMDYSNTTKTSYFINHCEFCDAKMGDFFLHEEADCAFAPMSINRAKQAKLTTLISGSEDSMVFGSFYRPFPYYIEKYAHRDKKSIFRRLFSS